MEMGGGNKSTAKACVRAAVLVALLLVLACGAEQREPVPTPTPWPYAPFRAQDIEIAAEVQLTEAGQYVFLSDVSGHGRVLVVGKGTSFGGSKPVCGVWLLDPPGGTARKLTGAVARYPNEALFSGDGERVVFAGGTACPAPEALTTPEGPTAGMWLLDLDTNERRVLYEKDAPILRAWFPDGRFLVERRLPEDEGGDRTLWIEREGGSRARVPDLVLKPTKWFPPPEFPSPDGSLLYYYEEVIQPISKSHSRFVKQVSMLDLRNGDSIWGPREVRFRPLWSVWAWSPDSRSLLYQVEVREGPQSHYDLMILNVDTGEDRLVLEDLRGKYLANLLAWSPDSRVILLRGDDYGTLYAVNADGTGLREVYSNPGAWYGNVHWSSDGGYLFYYRSLAPARAGEDAEERGRKQMEEYAVWAAVVRKPGESDAELRERVRQLQEGPWPVSLE